MVINVFFFIHRSRHIVFIEMPQSTAGYYDLVHILIFYFIRPKYFQLETKLPELLLVLLVFNQSLLQPCVIHARHPVL